MIKEALEYIVGMSRPNCIEKGGNTYSDKPLTRVDYDPAPEAIKTNTLFSIVEYVNADADNIQDCKLLIHVESPTRVCVQSYLNTNMRRNKYMVAEADIPKIRFGDFIPLEEFKIMLASCFADSDGEHVTSKENLLAFLSNVQIGTVADYGDDGISQKAEVKKGLAGREEALAPNPVELCPFRSFQEIYPVKSSFIFRMKEQNGAIFCVLFEADGGAWKNDCRKNITVFLMDYLKSTESKFHVLY